MPNEKLSFPGSLHGHSDYSNLRLRDAISTGPEMLKYAGELGHSVIAFTEHESVSNAIKIEKYTKKIKDKYPELKVIRGNEIYLCRNGLTSENFEKGKDKYYHYILLAKDAIGHQQIRELSTRAWMRSWVTNKMRRVPTYYDDLVEIVSADPGHLIGSTACLGGWLGTQLQNYQLTQDKELYQTIVNWVLQMDRLFGHNNFYLEMQPSRADEQIAVNKLIKQLSKELKIPYIITTDTHYVKKEDAGIHEAFLKSQDGDREVASFYTTTYMMGTEELENYMNDYLTEEDFQFAYQNILNIRNMCEDYTLTKPLKIPSLKWKEPIYFPEKLVDYYRKIPYLKKFKDSDFDGDKRLADLVISKLISDPRLQTEEVYNELNSNLETTWISSEVNKAHWSAYFLNLQQIIDVCWDAGTLVGCGRGSGVGFLLLYILDIIQINPLWEGTKTYSWRFLNPSRVSVLDIDTDIEASRRAQVLQALRNYYGEDRVANVVTFGTEGSKSAIQTAARGLGIDNDISLYIASLIPADRGKTRTLHQCYYGDDENDFQPIPLFVQQMKEYPELWETAQKIEGLVCRVGEHAGGVIFVDESFTNSTALMKVPNGDIVTQFDLHDSEDASLIKIDLLSIEGLDKIHACLDLLIEHKQIESCKTLRETYEKYVGIYNLERKAQDMWKMVWNHEILSLFQMEQQSGIQGIALTKPETVDDLAILNSVIRLMAQGKDEEQPLVKYSRFKQNIKLWYKEMESYHLTKEEQEILEPIVKISYGICESQEKFMSLVQLPECGGFDLNWADRLRKSIAKKNPAEYEQLTKEYFENAREKNLSQNLCNYVWNVLVATSRGYGFNASHTLAYSLVALQEMNLAYKYPIVFWNCACLISNSGGAQMNEDEETYFDEEDSSPEERVDIYEPEDFEKYEYVDAPDRSSKIKKKRAKTTDYKKIATAIGKMIQAGVNVLPPDINTSTYTFTPRIEDNVILYGLSGILNVGEDIIKDTLNNRPYSSPKDYLLRVKPKRQAMISLIKAGAFDNMLDRKLCMGWYIWETCDKKAKLNLQNMPTLLKYGLVPAETEEQKTAHRVYEFNRYLKAVCKLGADKYELDERAINFLIEMGYENLIDETAPVMGVKAWDKKYQIWMDVFRKWLSTNQETVLNQLNEIIFLEDWNQYASGTVSAWEMKALCFYYHEHELAHVNQGKYGFSDYFRLSEDPIVERSFTKGGKTINIFKLHKICGTCIAKDKNKGHVTLLTTEGVVNIKFRKEYFSMFDKQISVIQPDGTKKIMEKSWFERGSMIVVQGIRSGDNFIPKKYASSSGEQLYKIKSIDKDGDLVLTHQRYQGGIEEDEEN